jgi:hypothetical protein
VLHLTRVAGEEFGPAAQAVAQMARSANDVAMPDPFDVFSITVESDADSDLEASSRLAARLVGADDSPALKGAELVVGRGWLGVRRHPEPAATISFGGPAIPAFVDEALRQAFC